MCSKEEADQMMAVMKTDLPASFRITGTRSQAAALLRIIESKYFSELTRAKESGKEDVVVPTLLPWYPDRLAYQLNVTRKDIRRQEIYFRLHNFLVAETECGAISRQETVSMLPPLVLGVEPHHKVLDMRFAYASYAYASYAYASYHIIAYHIICLCITRCWTCARLLAAKLPNLLRGCTVDQQISCPRDWSLPMIAITQGATCSLIRPSGSRVLVS